MAGAGRLGVWEVSARIASCGSSDENSVVGENRRRQVVVVIGIHIKNLSSKQEYNSCVDGEYHHTHSVDVHETQFPRGRSKPKWDE